MLRSHFSKTLRRKAAVDPGVKYWEIIANNLSKAEWNYGYVSALDREGRTIWIVDAHGYGKRFIGVGSEVNPA